MNQYTAYVEVRERGVDQQRVGQLLERLIAYSATISQSPRGWLAARVTLPADNLLQATSSAVALVETVTGAQAVAAEVMLHTEFQARKSAVPMPELVGANDAAAMLGVSRVRVHQMIDDGTFPTAQKVGSGYVIARSDVESKSRAVAAAVATERLLGAGAGVGAAVRAGLRGQE
jgi:predicted DNA-binding transcriptional regulator AlpA